MKDYMKQLTSMEMFEAAWNSDQVSVFVFSADWCPDCMFVKPFIGDIVDANPEYKFYMINRDNMIDLCKDLDILGIPSFVAYNDKEESGRFVSKLRKTKEEIQAFIDTLK